MTAKPLHQLSLAIDPEAEEAVSALIEELWGQHPVIHLDFKTQRTTARVFLETPRRFGPDMLARFRHGLRKMRASGLSTGAGRIRITRIPREDWAESWKHHFKPFEIGPRLLVKPSWSRRRPRKNQKVVILDPGLSFGTGQHPTTRFCLQQLVRCRVGDANQSFLDLGTGSGILAIAAAKLGYRPVQAFDLDREAVRISEENARLNGVADRLAIQVLNVFDLPVRVRQKFEVIAANLTDDILQAVHRKILRRLAPSGTLILAGILHHQFPKVQQCFERAGTKLVSCKREKEWKSGAFVFSHPV